MRKKARMSWIRKTKYVGASFTIEAALLVPMLLALIFLLLQIILYLHDSVRAEAWLHQQAWDLRWSLENGKEDKEEDTGSVGTKTDILEAEAPLLAMMQYMDGDVVQSRRTVRAEASFSVRKLPRFVTAIFNGQPENTYRQVTEKMIDTPGFVKVTGAILEEKEE